MTTTGTIAGWLDGDFAALAARCAADPQQPAPGQGRWLNSAGGHAARCGRYPDGRYYIDLSYRVGEGYDDDYGSRTCIARCPHAAQPHEHAHRVADSWAGLAAAPTRRYSAQASLTA